MTGLGTEKPASFASTSGTGPAFSLVPLGGNRSGIEVTIGGQNQSSIKLGGTEEGLGIKE